MVMMSLWQQTHMLTIEDTHQLSQLNVPSGGHTPTSVQRSHALPFYHTPPRYHPLTTCISLCPGSPCLDLLLGDGLNHLGAKVIDGLHLRGLESQLANLGSLQESRFTPAQGIVSVSVRWQLTAVVVGRSIWISTTSPSMISVSSLHIINKLGVV